MKYEETIERVVQVVEGVGVAIMVVGALGALAIAGRALLSSRDRTNVYERLRRDMGRVILLGLEVLIIGDIVRTVVVEPTLDGVVVLGIVVVIRIVLSFALEVEIDGRWPWRQHESSSEADRSQPRM